MNLFSNRTFCSRVNEMLAAVVKLIRGVIQGSVIGPLMFLIYINDLIVLLSQYNIKLKLFTDDVKLYVKIVNNHDYVVLQKVMRKLEWWRYATVKNFDDTFIFWCNTGVSWTYSYFTWSICKAACSSSLGIGFARIAEKMVVDVGVSIVH